MNSFIVQFGILARFFHDNVYEKTGLAIRRELERSGAYFGCYGFSGFNYFIKNIVDIFEF